ncbi:MULTISPECIES: hypothetical protein [Legionella]|uniref:Uncharacterized protein n=1 Tax=Legionella quinlivanii TaxID=45073 RepID=A0A364LN91_9GAMM|nr:MULTISPECIES: hypothetical protein [Legionella]RAP38522.1 hypothetical protein B1207_01145 [Legionella quinlivanii]
MFQKIGMFCVGALLGAQAFAANYPLAPFTTIEYDLVPNKPEVLTNFTLFTIKAECELQTAEPAAILRVFMKKRSGTINDMPISEGDETALLVENGKTLRLTAVSAAVVELENKGNEIVHAKCRTVK